MNTTNQTLRFLGLGSILALALSIAPSAARAGGNLPPDAWRRATPVTNSTDIKPGDTVIMACPGLRWPRETGQVGSLSPNQKYDPVNVHETTSA